jgi:ribosome-associated translation inhibitor RaiA
MPAEIGSSGVGVFARGEVGDDERAYAQRKIEHLETLVPGPVLFARVELTLHGDPARERPAFAKAELDINGRIVRAHVAATSMYEAIDELEARLRERIERAGHHEEAKHLRFRGDAEHQWRHAQQSPPHRDFFPRPVEEREVVRHKTFSSGPMTPDEAVADLEALDHDFYLFENVETGEDNVVARCETGYELVEPSAVSSLDAAVTAITRSPVRPTVMTSEEAREVLDLTDRPYVFFLDAADGCGRVLYRRYDGHYGLIVPTRVTS